MLLRESATCPECAKRAEVIVTEEGLILNHLQHNETCSKFIEQE